MIRILFAFVMGAVCAAIAFLTCVIPSVRESWRAQGFNEGHISARWEISEKLGKEFPPQPQKYKNERTLFEVKTTAVYVSDCETGKQIHIVR